MKSVIIGIVTVLGLGGILIAANSNGADAGTSAKPSQSIQQIQSDVADGGTLLDVRTPTEYATAHIDGAINLPLQMIQSGAMPSVQKDKPVYVYCQSGNRSAQATRALKAAGYQNVIDLGAMAHVRSLGGTIKS